MDDIAEFPQFPKIPRLFRDWIITEKIDGTNASIHITPAVDRGASAVFSQQVVRLADLDDVTYEIRVGSRTRWITPGDDNYGFARWVYDNGDELVKLGPGHHFGEWFGRGIQRGYGLDERRFALFNATQWTPGNTPACCHVVPVLYAGRDLMAFDQQCLQVLREQGSLAVPGYKNPEGIIAFHSASGHLFKATCEHDEEPKSAHGKKVRELRPPKDPTTGGRRKAQDPSYAGPERRKAA